MRSPSRHVLQQIVASSSEGILLVDACDPDLKIVYVNPAYESLSGFLAEELLGAPWRLIQRDEQRSPELNQLRSAIGCAEQCQVTILDLHKDGTGWFSEVELTPLYGPRTNLKYFLVKQVAVVTESSGNSSSVQVDLLQRELGHARQRIANLSRTDAVTGLLNYQHFLSLLRRDLGMARRERRTVTVLAFEVVDLDVYRQTFGANAADSCLRMIGAQLAGAFRRAGDLCARYDESILVVSVHSQDESQVSVLAARVIDKVRGLGLHNPRGKSGRYLCLRSAHSDGAPDADDAETLVDRVRSELFDCSQALSKHQAS